MKLKRRHNIAEASSAKRFNDISDYIRVIVDIYSSSDVNRNLWLTEREKEFFIATVINYIQGNRNPISDEAVQIYKKYFSPATNKVKISDYINRVRKKEWVMYNKRSKAIEIPSIFHNIGGRGDEITFNLVFKWDE